jgi:uncharacterized membrane protein
MQDWENKPGDKNTENKQLDGQDFAILVESLYIANLLILPVFSFIALVLLFLKKHGSLPPLAESHLEQTIAAGIWIAVMVFVGGMTIMLMSLLGVEDVTLWLIVVILFTIMHATMVLLGVMGLAKALAGKCWRYPVVGKPLHRDCPR